MCVIKFYCPNIATSKTECFKCEIFTHNLKRGPEFVRPVFKAWLVVCTGESCLSGAMLYPVVEYVLYVRVVLFHVACTCPSMSLYVRVMLTLYGYYRALTYTRLRNV